MQAEASALEGWVNVFHTCRKNRDPWQAKSLLAHLRDRGLESHPLLSNYLVPMLVECGCLPEAHKVFDYLPVHHRNCYSWNCLISGYADRADIHHALLLYYQMEHPDRITYLPLLGSCASSKNLDCGMCLHHDILCRGLDGDVVDGNAMIGNTLVAMYGKCGFLPEACQVFEALRCRTAVSWGAIISSHMEHGACKKAFHCFEHMISDGIPPDSVTFVCILKACAALGNSETGLEVHCETSKIGLETDSYVVSSLIDMYIECEGLVEACHIFYSLQFHSIASWNALIAGYVEHGQGKEAVATFAQMLLNGPYPNLITHMCTLKGCCITLNLTLGQNIHADLIKRGAELDLHLGTTIVDLYMKSFLFDEAKCLFDKLLDHDALLWNVLIAGYLEHGMGEEALNCLNQMQAEGMPINLFVFVSSLKACGITTIVGKGQEFHAEGIKRGLDRDLHVGSALVDMYARFSWLLEARKILDALPVRDKFSWSALVVGYVEDGLSEEALLCLQEMMLKGFSPDSSILASCIKACSITGNIFISHELHSETVKRGFEGELHVGTALVDVYVACDCLTEACYTFDKLHERDAVSWNALIAGFAQKMLNKEVEERFQKMILEGISPNPVTFICGLKGCDKNRALEAGHNIHKGATVRGLEGEPILACALAKMYADCGSYIESHYILDRLPVQDGVSWSILISTLTDSGFADEVGLCLEQMLLECLSPSFVTLLCSLKACATEEDLRTVEGLHMEAIKQGVDSKFCVGNILVDRYGRCGLLAEAQQVFDKLPAHDAGSWCSLISGFSEQRLVDQVRECFQEMVLTDISLDSRAFVRCLKSCGSIGALDVGQAMYIEATKRGFDKDEHVGNMLLDMFGCCGSLPEAHKVFEKLSVQSVISWCTMIKAYGKNHQGSMAIQCFEYMQEQGVKPCATTYACLLTACSRSNLVPKSKDYLKLMRHEHEADLALHHSDCMVDLVARLGNICEAELLAVSMQFPPSCRTLCNLLAMCIIHGDLDLAQRYFQELIRLNVMDPSPYLLFADAFASVNRWTDAQRLEDMILFVGTKKRFGSALIEVEKKTREFIVSVDQYEYSFGGYGVLNTRMKDDGYVPNLELLSRC